VPTTINLRNLPNQLVRAAKAKAARHGITLKELTIRALSNEVSPSPRVARGASPKPLDTPKGGQGHQEPAPPSKQSYEAAKPVQASAQIPALPLYCEQGREFCVACGGFQQKA